MVVVAAASTLLSRKLHPELQPHLGQLQEVRYLLCGPSLPASPGILPFYNYYFRQRACTLEKGARRSRRETLPSLIETFFEQTSFLVC